MTQTLASRLVATQNRPSGFDYMRIILALSIICSHSTYLTHDPIFGKSFWESLMGPMDWGYFFGPLDLLIVPMFFALSGFLVAGSLERSKTLVTFLGLRVFRIAPALSVEVLLSALILGPLLTTVQLKQYFTDKDFYCYFLNILGDIHFMLPGVFKSNYNTQVNGQLWTIPAELACYIGLSALAISGIFKRRSLLLLVFIALYFAQTLNVVFRPNYVVTAGGSATAVLSFVAGLVIYRYRDVIRWSAGFFLLSFVLSVLLAIIPNGTRLIALPAAYVTIYLGLLNPKRNKIILSGDYSYGLYLYGFPIQQAFVALGGFGAEHWYGNLICSIPCVLFIAFCSWWLIEKPSLGQRRHLKELENWYLQAQQKWFGIKLKATEGADI
jgi:peptidoglycan/LPS O-acetylase OafA/YrhL